LVVLSTPSSTDLRVRPLGSGLSLQVQVDRAIRLIVE